MIISLQIHIAEPLERGLPQPLPIFAACPSLIHQAVFLGMSKFLISISVEDLARRGEDKRPI